VLGGWAWLTSIILAVIGRPSKNVDLQFGEMSDLSPTFSFVKVKEADLYSAFIEVP